MSPTRTQYGQNPNARNEILLGLLTVQVDLREGCPVLGDRGKFHTSLKGEQVQELRQPAKVAVSDTNVAQGVDIDEELEFIPIRYRL